MAVTAVNLIDREGDADGNDRSATDTYRVQVDAVADMNEIRLASDGTTTIPLRGDAYSASDPRLRVKKVTPRLEKAPDIKSWLVTVEYTTGNVTNENEAENPLDARPVVQWSDNATSEPWFEDIYDQALTNSAGEVFDPPIQKDIYDATVTITRNVLFYDEVTAEAYRGRVNNFSFPIRGASSNIAAFKAKIISYTGQEQVAGDFNYWTETIVIATRRDGWKRRLLDHGYSTRDPISGNKTLAKDVEGLPLNEPILLNGSGQKLPANAPAVFLVKELDDYVDFNNLNLPTGYA